MKLRSAALLLLSVGACALSGAESDATLTAQRTFLDRARAATFSCPVEDVHIERELSPEQPFRVELLCRQGVHESFILRRSPPGAPAAARYFEVVPADEMSRDLPKVEALLRESFVRDPWLDQGGTFGTSNAVGRGSEIAILIALIASLLGGLVFIVRTRPESPP